MILSFSSLEKSDLSKSSNFLFYGENQGRIEECTSITIESIKKDHGNVNFIYLSSDELKKGKSNISSNMNENTKTHTNIKINGGKTNSSKRFYL